MGRTAGRGGGDGENSFGEAGTSSTSAPRDPEPPLFYYSRWIEKRHELTSKPYNKYKKPICPEEKLYILVRSFPFVSEQLRANTNEVIMSGGPTRDRDRESSGETLVYELASESNESFIQSSDTVLPATSRESAMIQMSEPNKELEGETTCDSENQVQGVHLRESFIDLDPRKWVFPVND
ncbi:hypothetical protein TNCV_1243891 [Trichonephila clavipes]|nr:hypothetical protein TNCV_1243891 [Trichonephila clavipes]